MKNLSNKDAFDRMMGDCYGVDIAALTVADIRTQADYWNSVGETCDDAQIEAAIRGLEEYQQEGSQ